MFNSLMMITGTKHPCMILVWESATKPFPGSIDEAMDQEAYGKVMTGTQSGYHLTTKEYDSRPELYYFTARWYDNTLGCFVNKDPLTKYTKILTGINISPHCYNYCSNNPQNNIDAIGLSDKGCKCYEVSKSIREAGLETGWNSGCLSKCEANCSETGPNVSAGVFMSQCFRGCLEGEDCAKALANYYKCFAKGKAGALAAIKCAGKLGGCKDYVF